MKVEFERFLSKLLYIITSRSFIGFAFFAAMYAIITFKFVKLPGEQAKALEFIWSGLNFAVMTAFVSFLGKASFKEWLEFKGKSTK